MSLQPGTRHAERVVNVLTVESPRVGCLGFERREWLTLVIPAMRCCDTKKTSAMKQYGEADEFAMEVAAIIGVNDLPPG
jgi:hypothetical protein